MNANSANLLVVLLSFIIAHAVDAGASQSTTASGPLRVHPTNPRYFTNGTKMSNGSSRAVYLTGSHHWNNLQDSAKLGKPLTENFDYDGYLRLSEKFNHNFMRMWSWEVIGTLDDKIAFWTRLFNLAEDRVSRSISSTGISTPLEPRDVTVSTISRTTKKPLTICATRSESSSKPTPR